ncbi:MAG: terpene cyclase/mutase family protein [Planctomycetes bacterium]|nr:terpene cyclase/mutase family protein [Planctomycetota bacterium]
MAGRRAAMLGAAALPLLASGRASVQEPGTPAFAEVERVRDLVRKRMSPWIQDAKDRLGEEVEDRRGVDRLLDALRTEMWGILREEIRGTRVGLVLRPPPPPKEAPEDKAPEPASARPAPAVRHLEGRYGTHRARLRTAEGGSGTEDAVTKALEWLVAHQDPDGRWDCDGFSKQCTEPCGGPGIALHDVGVSGLALLALLGDGNLPDLGPQRRAVARGLKWLRSQQNPQTGLIGEPVGIGFLYGHAIATLALAEACAATGSADLRGPLERAVELIQKARNPHGVWRYSFPPNGDNDTSVTAWMALALKGAEEAGLAVDPKAYEGTLKWLDEMTDPASGRCGYQTKGEASSRRKGEEIQFPSDKTEALTAAALYCRTRLGHAAGTEALGRAQADRLRKLPPIWEPSPVGCPVDEYYWYYGTLAMFQMGGEDWRVWNAALKKALLAHQRRDGDAAGSWDPIGTWGKDGGRIYSTALGALCLEIYYRYPRRGA